MSKSVLLVGFQIVGRNNEDNLIANIVDEFMRKINWNSINYNKVYKKLY